jgi:hypothetical protein
LKLSPFDLGFFYIFHVYLEEWHSDVSRHWPFFQAAAVSCGWASSPALVSRLNVNCYGNHSMKKLLELRQQKAALKTQMRSMLDKADTEKRSLNEEEGKSSTNSAPRLMRLKLKSPVLKPSPTISAICLVLPLKVRCKQRRAAPLHHDR